MGNKPLINTENSPIIDESEKMFKVKCNNDLCFIQLDKDIYEFPFSFLEILLRDIDSSKLQIQKTKTFITFYLLANENYFNFIIKKIIKEYLMKKIKMIIVFLLLISNLLKAETLEMNLVTFATLTSEANNINILIDEELRKENFVFIVNDNEPYLLSAFRKAVTLRGLELVFTEEFYYVRNKEAYLEEPKYRAIKLNFVKFEDIVNFLNVYEDKIKYEFIKTSKTLLLKSKENEFKSIYQMIKSIDILPTQLKLKITILDTNIDKLIENGADYTNLNFTNNSNFFFNLMSYPFTVKNELSSDDSKGFYTFLKFLNENSISELKSSPVLSLSDEQQSILDVSDNVPTLTGSVTVDDNDTKTTQAYEYKDVGTRIVVTPHIYKNEDNEINVYLGWS